MRAAFARNFRDEGEGGAAVCALVSGRCVVDLWGGFADLEDRRPWRRDTLVNVFSAGKGLIAMLALARVEAGELALDAEASALWPELAAAGKHGYHVNTWGFLVGELLRRASGLPVETLLARELGGALGADFHLGVPASEHGNARTLARAYAGFLAQRSSLLDEALRTQSEGEELVLGRPSRFGLGFQLQRPGRSLGPGERSFGHFGHGGSVGLADPDAGLAFAYVTSRPGPRLRSPRTDRLLEALPACL